MLTSLDHSSLQPWLYGCSLAVCSALYAFFAFAALVIPTHGLAIGTSLLRGTYLRTDGEDRLAWAVGLIDVVAADDFLSMWWKQQLDRDLQARRFIVSALVFLTAIGSGLASTHWYGFLHRRHGHILVSNSDLLLRTLLQAFCTAAACAIAFCEGQMVNNLQRQRPPEGFIILNLRLGPTLLLSYCTLAATGAALCLACAQALVTWYVGRSEDSAGTVEDFEATPMVSLTKPAPTKAALDRDETASTTKDDQAALTEEPEDYIEGIPPPSPHPLLPNSPPYTATPPSPAYTVIPQRLIDGVTMLKVSALRSRPCQVRIVPEEGRLIWDSRRAGVLNFENIRFIRYGLEAMLGRPPAGLPPGELVHSVVITYGGAARRVQTLHLVAQDEHAFRDAKSALDTLHSHRQALLGGHDQLKRRERAWLRQLWIAADTNGDDHVDVSEALELCKRIGIADTRLEVERHFSIVDINADGLLDRNGFTALIKRLGRRADIEHLLNTLTRGSSVLDKDRFTAFLHDTQGSNLDVVNIDRLYAKFADQEGKRMTLEGFASFLLSSENAPTFDSAELGVGMSMTRPLHDYFISSSHNTYLIGNQLAGESTVEGYISALRQGCRCVEVDLWDGPDGQPIVKHGHTMTTSLPAHECFTAIAKYAFIASPYPIILSLESHLSIPQQERLVEILHSTLGKALLDMPLAGIEGMPSPHDLRYRILVKTKHKDLAVNKPSPLVIDGDRSDSEGEEIEGLLDGERTPSFRSLRPASPTPTRALSPAISTISSNSALASPRLVRRATSPALPTTPVAPQPTRGLSLSAIKKSAPDEKRASRLLVVPQDLAPGSPGSPRRLSLNRRLSDFGAISPDRRGSFQLSVSGALLSPALSPRLSRRSSDLIEAKPKMAIELTKLLIYTVGVKYHGFSERAGYAPFHLFSLAEAVAAKAIRTRGLSLAKHCLDHLARAYPSPLRVDSSNFLPQHLWAKGVQLVALNLQTYDLAAEMNAALFSRNGGCGYVLRPSLDVSLPKDYTLDVKILSAQRLATSTQALDLLGSSSRVGVTLRSLRPSVSVAIYSPDDLCSTKPAARHQTHAVRGNYFSPIFDASFSLAFTCAPEHLELAFIEFRVHDGLRGEAVIGRFCISVASLQPGYRHLPLVNHVGNELLWSTLFVCTALREE